MDGDAKTKHSVKLWRKLNSLAELASRSSHTAGTVFKGKKKGKIVILIPKRLTHE